MPSAKAMRASERSCRELAAAIWTLFDLTQGEAEADGLVTVTLMAEPPNMRGIVRLDAFRGTPTKAWNAMLRRLRDRAAVESVAAVDSASDYEGKAVALRARGKTLRDLCARMAPAKRSRSTTTGGDS